MDQQREGRNGSSSSRSGRSRGQQSHRGNNDQASSMASSSIIDSVMNGLEDVFGD